MICNDRLKVYTVCSVQSSGHSIKLRNYDYGRLYDGRLKVYAGYGITILVYRSTTASCYITLDRRCTRVGGKVML